MEFFNTPELFVNYNWIISALFGEFRHSRPCQVGVGVVVSRWEMDVFPLRREVLFYPHGIIRVHIFGKIIKFGSNFVWQRILDMLWCQYVRH